MYQLSNDDQVRRLSDGALIPPDEGNRDWRDYLAWIEAGGIAEPDGKLAKSPSDYQPEVSPESDIKVDDFIDAIAANSKAISRLKELLK